MDNTSNLTDYSHHDTSDTTEDPMMIFMSISMSYTMYKIGKYILFLFEQ